jgi:3-phenylpropionate/trans-cinnamate dioxygenase ferredoxin subunit
MAFSKYKWYKLADKETDLQWTAGAVAEIIVKDKKLCIGRFQPPAASGLPGVPAALATPAAPGVPANLTPAVPPPQLFGFAHTCPHAGAPMTDGYIDGACNVVCPVHQLKFNLKNGRDTNGEGYKLKTYPVEVRADGIFIGIDEGGLFKWF